MRKLLLIIFVSLGLIGCSTTPPSQNEIKNVPMDRVFSYQNNDSSNIIVVRDKGIVGSACFINFFINGKESAKLETKERASFYVPSGEIILGASLEGRGLCSFNAPRRERSFILKVGDVRYFRLSIDPNGNTDIMPTTL